MPTSPVPSRVASSDRIPAVAIRAGGVLLGLGATLWIASEVIETLSGGFSRTSVAVLIAGRVLLALSAFSIAAHQLSRTAVAHRTVVAGAGLLTVAMGLLVVLEVVTYGAPDEGEVLARAGLLYPAAFGTVSVATILVGVAVLRARVYPRWTGFAEVGAILVIGAVAALKLPTVLQSGMNVMIMAALIATAATILRHSVAR